MMIYPSERVSLTLLPFLPIVSVAWAIIMCIVLISLFITQDNYESGRLPTISYTAKWFPGSRVIAVGLGVMGVFIIFVYEGLSTRPILSGHSLGGWILWISRICAAGFVATGAVNIGELPDLHGLFAAISFLSLLIANLLVAIAQKQLGQLKLMYLQFGILIFGFVCVIGVLITSWMEQTNVVFSLMGITEYGILVSAAGSLGFAYFEFLNLEISLVVDLTEGESLAGEEE
jgi:hypothetical protein